MRCAEQLRLPTANQTPAPGDRPNTLAATPRDEEQPARVIVAQLYPLTQQLRLHVAGIGPACQTAIER